ncbi:MAG: tetraacyldisaccharide 4'-kinase [Candidatus Delongbacteria bacterium]|nr:tetraacyldisaccharide 4'-kinase [Candidatus Delongbacteria bacterium]
MFYSNFPILSALISLLLLPFTILYWTAVVSRNFLYDINFIRSYKSKTFTVSVGNITAGGTGKTPTVISIVNSIVADGKKPVVITRGYGRKTDSRFVVSNSSSVSESGDEPMTIFKKTGVEVICDKNRTAAVKEIEDKFDVIVLDDAFQHRKIRKHSDIVLVDENRFFGNGLLLPSGILRDTASRLYRSDIIILSKVRDETSSPVSEKLKILRKYGKKILISKILCPFISNGKGKKPVDSISGSKIALFCGIGNPNDFFYFFSSYDVVSSTAFSDHFDYSGSEARLSSIKKNSDILITTYKDFVKLSDETVTKNNIYYIDIELEFYDEDLNPVNIWEEIYKNETQE